MQIGVARCQTPELVHAHFHLGDEKGKKRSEVQSLGWTEGTGLQAELWGGNKEPAACREEILLWAARGAGAAADGGSPKDGW